KFCIKTAVRFFLWTVCSFHNHDIALRHSTKGQTFAGFCRDKEAEARANLEQVDGVFLASSDIGCMFRRIIGTTVIGSNAFRRVAALRLSPLWSQPAREGG